MEKSDKIKKIDKEIEELTKKINDYRRGFEKTIHDFSKETLGSRLDKHKSLTNKLIFNLKNTITSHLAK
jgi:hypothetical protein